MQTVSSTLTAKTSQRLRRITTRVLISFEKNYDAAIDFFTIGVSTIGGTDILKGESTPLQEWDKYDYDDFSGRVLSVEVDRETDPPVNQISVARATIVLDNTDDIFTPDNSASPYYGFLLPRRPVRINLGFSDETVPKFIGLTEGPPEIDDSAKTAKFRCIDFLSSILAQPLDEELIFVDYRTDEVVQAILEGAGLSATQFDLDVGSVFIPFTYFKKGMKRSDALKEALEAELGNLSLSETGLVVFRNRQNWATNVNSWNFDQVNTYERKTLATSTVINVVEVLANARQVQAKQSIWAGNSPITFSDGTNTIRPGETKYVFADFEDADGSLPVTTVDDPDPITSATTSFYHANTELDGSGFDLSGDVDLISTDLFSTAFKMTFTNNGTRDAYIIQLELFGTPAKIISRIYKRVVDSASVGTFDGQDEQVYRIENDLIQDETAANTLAQTIIGDRAEDDDQQRLIVKAVPQLQLGDVITYTGIDVAGQYFVTRINDIISASGGYRQVLQTSKRTINTYYRIGLSTIGGSDLIGP